MSPGERSDVVVEDLSARFAAALRDEPSVRLSVGSTEFVLLGTAHVSRESAETVRRLLALEAFDVVAVELCEARARAINDPDALARMNLFEVIRSGRAPMVAASLALGAYQTRLAEQYGIEPGAEMRAAMEGAFDRGIALALIDRDVGLTLRRAYRAVPWWQRWGLVGGLLGSVLSRDEIAEQEIERLKEGDLLESTFDEFAAESAPLYRILIDERDAYMAAQLARLVAPEHEVPPRRVLVVVGAGHLAGIARRLEAFRDARADAFEVSAVDTAATGRRAAAAPLGTSVTAVASVHGESGHGPDPDAALARLETTPPKARWPKFVPWVIVAVILTGFAIGFSRNPGLGWQLVLDWVLINGGLAALGAIIAGAHPLTIIGAMFAAPLTSLNPTIGVGFVAAAIEIWLRKPEVGDFARLRHDATSARGWWRNRVSRVFLVFLLTTFGSAIGTYAGGAWILGRLFAAGDAGL